MSLFPWLVMLGFVIVGSIYTYRVAQRLADKKENENYTTKQMLDECSLFELACFLVFGPFVVVAHRIYQKLRGWS